MRRTLKSRAWYERTLTPIPHGTYGGYTNHYCRCDECKAARAEYSRQYRLRKQQEKSE